MGEVSEESRRERRPCCQAIRSHSKPFQAVCISMSIPYLALGLGPQILHSLQSPFLPRQEFPCRHHQASHLLGSASLYTALAEPQGALERAVQPLLPALDNQTQGALSPWPGQPAGPLPIECQVPAPWGGAAGVQTGSSTRAGRI